MVEITSESSVPSTFDTLNSPCRMPIVAGRVTWHENGVGAIALQRETRVADISVGRREKKWVETALLSQKSTRTTHICVPGDPGESRWMKRYSKTDCMEPIANCMHAIPIPYWFQYEKCKKKTWELQAYTYTAFVAPLQIAIAPWQIQMSISQQ